VNHRTWTVVSAGLLALALGVLGATLPVPLVALGPGPTFNTLGEVDGTMVVAVSGLTTYPTAGNLNMTTVSVTDRLTLFNAIGFWAAGDHQVVPRDSVFPADKSDAQVQQENTEQFASSEANAEVAALTDLKLPTRAVVSALTPGSPATGRLQAGDELVTVAGKPVTNPQQVSDALTGTTPGQSVTIAFKRAGKQQDTTVVLGSSPDRPQGLLGVRPGIEPQGGDITISLGDIGGPSAGLMFTGRVPIIAGTGANSTSEAIHLTRAAKAAGATTFLVPAANCTEAAANDPDGLALVRVGTLSDALTALDALRANKPVVGC